MDILVKLTRLKLGSVIFARLFESEDLLDAITRVTEL